MEHSGGINRLPKIQAGATLSRDGVYRYTLTRVINNAGLHVVIVGVNPSTADATIDDATIRKLMGFGRRLGWRSFTVVNKFAFRATDVKALRTLIDPVGPANDYDIAQAMKECNQVIVAWGPLGKLPRELRDRWKQIVNIAQENQQELWCWGTAKDGQPRHPLMLSYKTPLVKWAMP